MAKLNIKKGDTVVVIAGKDNGKVAEVLDCFPAEKKVTVKGVNIVVKHNKPRSAQDKGGIVKFEGKIPASNVMVVCPVCNKATRVAIGTNEKGDKARVCKKCGAVLDAGKKVAAKKAPAAKATKEAKVEEKPAAKKTATKTTAKTAEKETKKTVKAEKPATAKKASSTAKKTGDK